MNPRDNARLVELQKRITGGDALRPGELQELLRLNARDYQESQRETWGKKSQKKYDKEANSREGGVDEVV
jgi:hypothetical protein